MNKTKLNRLVSMLLVVLMLMSVVAFPVLSSEDRFPIKIIMWHDMAEFPAADNEVEQIIEDYTNTDLDIVAYGSDYNTILPTIVASGELPDILAIPPGVTPNYIVDLINAGMAWDIADAVAASENLSRNNPIFYNNIKVQGNLYSLPKMRALVRRVFMYRADWFEKLGIEVPTTTDELYDVLVKIKAEMPTTEDGRTIFPLVIDRAFRAQFGIMFGAPNIWRRNEDGSYTRDATTPEFMEAMKFVKKLYSEGLLHPDYAILDRNRDVWGSFANGTAAIIRDSSQQIGACTTNVQKNFPEAKVGAFSLIAGPDGEIRTMGESGNNGTLLFIKDRYNNEEDMKKLVDFFDKLGDREMANLFTWGIEDKHYNIVNGQIVPIEDMLGDYGNNIRMAYRYTLLPFVSDSAADSGIRSLAAQQEFDIDRAGLEHVFPNDSFGLFSPTEVERGNLEVILEDAYLNFVTGAIDEAGYQAEVDRWRAEGGDQIAKEYAEYYAQYNK
jgi:putative aldouronate transport system substrate-binding protein